MFTSSAEMVMLLFVASQFISIFRETNIGTIIATWGANILGSVSFSALPLIIISLVLIAIANIFVTTPSSKWQIFAPVMVPAMMQANISPQFAQFILRAGDSMTAGITPLLAAFAIYIGYLNIYNKDKNTNYNKSLKVTKETRKENKEEVIEKIADKFYEMLKKED